MPRALLQPWSLLRSALVVAALATAAPIARADVPPLPASTDDCTLEKQCSDGVVCPALGGEVDKACSDDAIKKGMVQKCIQPNPMKGKAVFCPAAKKGGCGKSAVAPRGDGQLGGSLLATALAVAALRRARSRRSPTR